MGFISQERAIILAISPANSDLANSDSLNLAKEVDPHQKRTIGVITKLDLVDKGTNVRDILLNKVYPLELGYIGVVNRSQKDILENKPMEKVIESERRFFITSSDYKDIADTCGYKYLASTLNRLLMNHIKATLPSVHQEINRLLARKEKELAGYGQTFGDNKVEQQMYLYRMIEHYLSEFSSLLNGTSDSLRVNGIDGGQYLMEYLINDFHKKLNEISSALSLEAKLVGSLIESNSGIQRSLFFPEATFHCLVKEFVEKMRNPAIESAEVVHHRMMELHTKVNLPELDRFPKVKSLLSSAIADIARGSVDECLIFINQIIDIQSAYINSEHHSFKERTRSTIQGGSISNNQELLLELVDRYFNICKREVVDIVPKAIHRLIIKRSIENLRIELFSRLVTNPDLAEDPDVASRRKKCLGLIKSLKEAASLLNEVRMAKII